MTTKQRFKTFYETIKFIGNINTD